MVTSIDLQELGALTVVHGEVDDPSMRYFNPSIASHLGKIYISIRSCNFAVERNGKWSFRDNTAYSKTDVLYGTLNPETLQVSNLATLTLSKDSPTTILLAGLEDVRLFSRKDGMHAIGFESDRLTRSLHNQSASLAEYLITPKSRELKYIRTLKKPDREMVEKNWSPTDVETKEFDFTYSPTQVWKDGKVTGDPYKGNIHGGTQLLKQKDGTYLSIVHEKKLEPKYVNQHIRFSRNIYDKYTYYSYLAKHDSKGVITELSKPFRFGTLENIEFASGMVEYKSDLLISIGIRDCKWAIVKIDKNKLMNLLDK